MTKIERAGFTLMELMTALSITGIILLTVMYLSTNAVRYQTESVIRDQTTAGALYSLAQMRRELEDATYLQATPGGCGNLSSSGCDQIGGCLGWSAIGGAYAGATVKSFYYCLDGNNELLRFEQPGCNTGFSAGCVAGAAQEVVVANPPGIYHNSESAGIFVKSGDTSVDLHYLVGYPGQKANLPVPVDYLFNIRVNTNKAYTDTSD